MPAKRVQRRLAAIVAVDVVGFSRLMEADETGTLDALKDHRAATKPISAKYGARLVGTAGDGQIWEFASVVDAVTCSVEVQTLIAERNDGVPEDRRIAFRVGVNLGDVIIDGDDILGDGVNVAARLEGLAEPGGICVSGNVHEQVAGKTDITFEDMGEQTVKNINKPVHVYAIRLQGEATPAIDVSAPVPGFGGRPAIAVLPFDNLSGDPDQEYFVDGIVEDIITRLAMWRWIPVIARNSTFSYKGRAVKMQQVAKELGTRYVLEGSVRKGGNRIRITAQLIDAETGHHVWAERYDRDLVDIFALQDEIADSIVASLEPIVGRTEIQRAHAKRPENLDAWDLTLRANWHMFRMTPDDVEEAIRLYRASVELDPNQSFPWSWLTWAYYIQLLQGWLADPAEAVSQSIKAAKMALSLDDRNPVANSAAGWGRIMARDHDAGLEFLERAIELNPSYPYGHFILGSGLNYSGRPEEGAERIQAGMRLSPNDPTVFFWFATLSRSYYQAKQYEKALESARKCVRMAEHYPAGQQALCLALAMLGRLDEAKAALARFLELSPGYSVERARATMPFRHPEDFDHYIEGFRRAGWTG